MFDGLNVGKRDVTFNLKHPEAVELVRRLIFEWADAVAENFAPRAMRGFGLDYDDARGDKPDLVMVSACLNGQTGPHRDYPGFGGQGSALAGLQLPDRLARPRARRPPRHHHRLARTALRRHRARGRRCSTAAAPGAACTSTSPRSRPRSTPSRRGCSSTRRRSSPGSGPATTTTGPRFHRVLRVRARARGRHGVR